MFGFPFKMIEKQLGNSQLLTIRESRSKECDNGSEQSDLTHEGSDILISEGPLLKSTIIHFSKSLSHGQEDSTIKIDDDNDIFMVSYSFCDNNLF